MLEDQNGMEMSPPARVVWIEIIAAASSMILFLLSPPARVVWIEITQTGLVAREETVATREGGVD